MNYTVLEREALQTMRVVRDSMHSMAEQAVVQTRLLAAIALLLNESHPTGGYSADGLVEKVSDFLGRSPETPG